MCVTSVGKEWTLLLSTSSGKGLTISPRLGYEPAQRMVPPLRSYGKADTLVPSEHYDAFEQ